MASPISPSSETELVVGRFVVEKNSLRVTSPESIKGTHDSAIGNFGIPQYGGSMAGTVVYPKDNKKGCKSYDDFGISFKAKAGALPNFVLVDRGDCFFALKVWNAQNAGAAAVLVADDLDEALITMDSPEESGASAKYIANITIPSALIDKSFGEKLKKAVNGGDMAFTISKQCKSQCLNHGRYCAPDPEEDFSTGYDGKDVIRCPMKEKKYNTECAEVVVRSLGLDLKKIQKCMGDPDADSDNPVLKEEQDAQIGKGTRGDVTILPTLVVNNRQYRGKLEKGAVLKALCSGFEETTEPSVCLGGDVETNECLDNNGGCWEDKTANVTACKDTFRGRVCECPVVNGVQFKGDGYRSCVGNGYPWTALDNEEGKCTCPPGFKGDGVKSCEDIDECKDKKVCQCPECSCKNNWGSFECTCSGDLLYMRDQDTCIGKTTTEVRSAWTAVWIILLGLAMAAGGAYLLYKYRLRSYMDSEIRAIMAQYMPLDSQNEVQNHVNEDHA
ncbi:hypothetical protein DH2020_006525 [Rehmannia glutinosa]|uniref:EGF-like calcium-binding domain-containing protein n=1 Tax=Rehmannia glutinosa TaxID=99300 RepID=A0ABR0XJQ8_REHGL